MKKANKRTDLTAVEKKILDTDPESLKTPADYIELTEKVKEIANKPVVEATPDAVRAVSEQTSEESSTVIKPKSKDFKANLEAAKLTQKIWYSCWHLLRSGVLKKWNYLWELMVKPV